MKIIKNIYSIYNQRKEERNKALHNNNQPINNKPLTEIWY